MFVVLGHCVLGSFATCPCRQCRLQVLLLGLATWSRGWESTGRRRGHGIDPWSGKMPRSAGELSMCGGTAEARVRESLCSETREAPAIVDPTQCNWRECTRSTVDSAQPKIKKEKDSFFKKRSCFSMRGSVVSS